MIYTTLRETTQQALEAWQRYLLGECPQWKLMESFEALRAALEQQAEPQDAELSAALGWPGGISEPVLDRKTLLRQVADLRAALASSCDEQRHELWESGGIAGCDRARAAERQRDALLEALKRMASIIDKMGDMPDRFIHPTPWQTLRCEEALTQTRAAIKAVEETK